jgi:hypothetical protein
VSQHSAALPKATVSCDQAALIQGADMADASRKAQLTAELLQLTQQQQETLQDAIFLGWQLGQLDAYQERGERVSVLRQELNRAVAEENLEVLADTAPITPDIDAEPS